MNKETLKFWMQILVIPIVLLVLGFMVDDTLQKRQRALDKIKFTDQVLNEAFDSDNARKAIALSKLIPQLVEDSALSDTLVLLLNSYITELAKNAVQIGDDSLFAVITEAVRYSNLTALDKALTDDPVTNQARKAINLENEALEKVQLGDLVSAQKKFAEAGKQYPALRSASEISNIINKKYKDLSNSEDSAKAKAEILDAVKTNYAWKASVKRKVPAK